LVADYSTDLPRLRLYFGSLRELANDNARINYVKHSADHNMPNVLDEEKGENEGIRR
jgi:hypothetical protein